MLSAEYPRLHSEDFALHLLRLGVPSESREGPSQIGCCPQCACMLRPEKPSLHGEHLALDHRRLHVLSVV